VVDALSSTVRISPKVVDSHQGTGEPWVRLVITDDGVGLDPAKMDRPAEGHLGLRLLVDRVESLGGKLLVTSAVGRGTTIQAELPARPRTEITNSARVPRGLIRRS
jgi:nitrate/nitrite-specific signal transduction histidine kinase